jgi:hypothetical protein
MILLLSPWVRKDFATYRASQNRWIEAEILGGL